jgi:acetylornithine deacetylase
LEKLWAVHSELMALEARRNDSCTDPLFRSHDLPFALSIGKVNGGDWASSVPDRVEIEGRYGLSPGEGVEEARQAFQQALDRASQGDPWLADHPPELVWWGGHFLPAQVQMDNEVVSHLRGAFKDLYGSGPKLEGVTFGSDMRLLVHEAGTPTVLFGPGDVRQAHAADESVSVVEVEQTARTLALMALRFCGYEE